MIGIIFAYSSSSQRALNWVSMLEADSELVITRQVGT